MQQSEINHFRKQMFDPVVSIARHQQSRTMDNAVGATTPSLYDKICHGIRKPVWNLRLVFTCVTTGPLRPYFASETWCAPS